MLDLKCVHFWCILGTRDSCMQISSYIRRLNIVRALKKKKKKKDELSSQRPKETLFFGKMTQPLCLETPFSNPRWTSLGRHPGMLVG